MDKKCLSAADARCSVHKSGLQLIVDAKAHRGAQRHTVDRIRRNRHIDLQFFAQVLRQTVQLCAAAGKHYAVAENVTCQLRRGLFQYLMSRSTDIEKIDIGGISLIRAGAKNFKDVVIVPSKAEYGVLLDILNKKGAQTDLEDRKMFATRAFGVAATTTLPSTPGLRNKEKDCCRNRYVFR